MPQLSSMLRTLRVQAGLTQVRLAELLHASQSTISHVERGGVTTSDVVEEWVKACGGMLVADRNSDELSAALAALGREDREYLIRIAAALPGIPDSVSKRAMVAALEQMGRKG
jgi:transcriptional regulator with XRE-family HTH domain